MRLKMRLQTPVLILGLLITTLLLLTFVAAAQTAPAAKLPDLKPQFSTEKAFDVSPPARDLAAQSQRRTSVLSLFQEPIEVRPERGPIVKDTGFTGDGAIQGDGARFTASVAPLLPIPAPLVNFEGLSNQDNFNLYGFR
jgi:hypothetical protein